MVTATPVQTAYLYKCVQEQLVEGRYTEPPNQARTDNRYTNDAT